MANIGLAFIRIDLCKHSWHLLCEILSIKCQVFYTINEQDYFKSTRDTLTMRLACLSMESKNLAVYFEECSSVSWESLYKFIDV